MGYSVGFMIGAYMGVALGMGTSEWEYFAAAACLLLSAINCAILSKGEA